MTILFLLLLAGTPQWAVAQSCCQQLVCQEPAYRTGSGAVCFGDLLCHPCDTPCLTRYVNRDGGVECADDSRPLPDGGYEKRGGGR